MGCYALFLLFWIEGFFLGTSISTISTAPLHHQLQQPDACLNLKAYYTRNLQHIGYRARNFPREERPPLIPHSPKDNEDTSYMKQLPQLLKCPDSFSFEIEAMVDIFRIFKWHETIFIHQDSQSSNKFASQFVDAFRDKEILISNKISISSSVSYFNTLKILSNIAQTQTRIILVDMTDVSVGSRVILAAKEAGLMSKGYAWLITNRMSKMLNSMDQNTLNIMEGALAVRPHHLQGSTKTSLMQTCDDFPIGKSVNIMHFVSFEVFNILSKSERVVAYWRPYFSFSIDWGEIEDVIRHPNYVMDFRKIIWPGDSTMVPSSCDMPMAIRTRGPWRLISR